MPAQPAEEAAPAIERTLADSPQEARSGAAGDPAVPFLAFPVVDNQRHLLGVVDVELYTDKATQLDEGRVRDDLFQLLGVPADEARDRSPLGSFRRRFPWLGCNLAAGTLAAFLSSAYKDELNRVVALAFFIPVVLNLAESVSSQSVSLALQVLHGQSPSWKMIPGRLVDELATGLMLGLAAGAAVGLVGLIWLGQARFALCLMGGICGGVAGAAMMGTALPHTPQESTIRAGALPGQALVVLDPSLMLVTDVVLCEDGHAQERSLLGQILEIVRAKDVWIDDRNFCTTGFLFGIAPARLSSWFVSTPRRCTGNSRARSGHVGDRDRQGLRADGAVDKSRHR